MTNHSAVDLSYAIQALVPNHTTVAATSIGQGGSCGVVVCTPGRTIGWSRVIGAGQAIAFPFAALVDTSNPPSNGTVIRTTASATGGGSGAIAEVDVAIAP